MQLKIFSNLLVFVATVAAHGYVDNVTVNGMLYTVSVFLFSKYSSES